MLGSCYDKKQLPCFSHAYRGVQNFRYRSIVSNTNTLDWVKFQGERKYYEQ